MSKKSVLTDKAVLVLSDGTRFDGLVYKNSARAIGELLVDTELVGYQEKLSDSHNIGKILLFTTPHIGNTGVNDEDAQGGLKATGVIMRDPARRVSNFRAKRSLTEDLLSSSVTALHAVDTRAITRLARDKNLNAGIFSGEDLRLSDSEQLELVKTFKSVGA